MTQTESRQIRVFISSTFRDMQAERDYLVKFIFPQLRKLCESRSVTWGEVDLRWGITDEQSAEGKVLPICLAEIERSRPYFIGLLGERYGWIPDSIDPELIAQEPWLAQHLEHSVTELEILHGVLNDSEMNDKALFYFRDPAYIESLDESELADHIEVPWREDIESYGMEEAQKRVRQRQEKLSSLKDRIRRSGLALRENFQSPQQLGEWVLADLTRIIDQRFPEEDKPDPLSRESALHEAFAQNRARLYIGGEAYFTALDQHAAQGKLPLVLLGESGSGKSALLANWALRYQREHSDSFVICHFIGASPNSADLTSMLLRIMRLLKQRFALPEELPANDKQIRSAFTNWLAMAAARGKLVLVLDGLNQLDNRDSAQELDWLPLELPENLTIFLSTLPSRALEVIKERDWPSLLVLPLSMEERSQIVQKYLAFYSKELSPARIQRIVEDPQSENPLALRLLLDELRQFGKHEALDDVIGQYLAADSLPEMFQIKLERLEEDLEIEQPGLVRRALSLLWAARFGLSEVELLEVLGEPGQPLPGRFWSPLSLALESSLVDRNGLISFTHDYLRQAVEERYLKDKQNKTEARLALANYFEKQEGLNKRKLDELPWQLSRAKDWQRLYGFMKDLDVFEALYKHSQIDLMTYWAVVETNSDLTRIQAYQSVLENPGIIPWSILNWLSHGFLESGYLKEAIALNKEQESICRQLGNLDGLQASLENQALILKNWGKLEEAMALHKEVEQISRQLGDLNSLQASLGNQANILYAWGKLEEAMALHKDQESICRQLGDLNGLQISLGNQALILENWGKLEEAMALHKGKESICRQLGNLDGLSASLGNQALILQTWGKLEEAMAMYKEQESISRQLGNLNSLQISLGNQALILSDWGKPEEAMALLKEAEQISRQLGNLNSLQISLGNQALILQNWGKLEEAMALHKQEEEICHQLHNQDGLQRSLGNQALILQNWGKLEEAMALLKEQESISRQLGNLNSLQISLGNQAVILENWGKLEEAMELHKQEEDVCHQLGNLNSLQISLGNQALILQNWGKLEEAMALLKEQERISRQLRNQDGLQRSLGNQANILYAWGKLEEAMALHKQEEEICRQLGNLDGLSASLGNQALILQNWGKLEEAMALHKQEEEICHQLGNLNGLSASLGNQANILYARGKLEDALALLKEQESICRQLGNTRGLCVSLAKQALIRVAQEDRQPAKTLLHEALQLAKEHNFNDLVKSVESIMAKVD